MLLLLLSLSILLNVFVFLVCGGNVVDNEFGEILSGAGCRPQFANLVRYQKKYEASQNDFPVALIIKSVHLEVRET